MSLALIALTRLLMALSEKMYNVAQKCRFFPACLCLFFRQSRPVYNGYYRWLCLLCVVVFCFLLLACNNESSKLKDPDLIIAEKALAVQDLSDAEMYFERYLRKNPEGSERWRVWNSLLDIALNRRQEKNTARAYLEIMLVEFSNVGERRRGIQMSLAALCAEMNNDIRAIGLWETLVADPELSVNNKADMYRALARAYMRRLDFSLSAETLQACLDLPLGNTIQADCLYDMAEGQMLTDNQPKAAATLRSLLQMPEVTPERRVLATFMLAEVLEQLDKYAEAKEMFESIRESYPNEKIIDLHILFLNKHLKQ